MINTVIIDDEKKSRAAISAILTESCPEVRIVGEADSVSSGIEVINKLKPDLIFLDIRMTDGTGFNLLSQFDHLDFHIIFITGYEEYALKAIKISALDYILKPINPYEIIAAIEKYKAVAEKTSNQHKQLTAKTNLFRHISGKPHKITIRTSDSLQYINIEEIIRLQSERNYTSFYLKNGKSILVSKTLGDFESLLDGYGFLRVQQSHIINVQYVVRYVKSEGGYIVMCDESKIPISIKIKDAVLSILESI
ncbi:MAG: LytTR family DNA-binding domain-containing protein [Bacteroidota bacterium]